MGNSRSSKTSFADKRVVTLGGGTGPYAILSQLKHTGCAITAVVSMADSGGSSRRLMDEFGQLPLGDLRQALVALSRNNVLWRDIFNHRFRAVGKESESNGVAGHSLGNLIISALQEINEGNLLTAIQDAQELLQTAGDVLPVTLDHTTLCAEYEDGSVICGETDIDRRGERSTGPLPALRRVYLDHVTPPCHPALRALRRADVIVIGPGDLYTSILPTLLVDGVARAIREAEAERVYICNLMTKRGETDGYRASDFVRVVEQYLGGRVDRVIVHDGTFPEPLVRQYAAQGQHPVLADMDAVHDLATNVMMERMVASTAEFVRHDPEMLLQAIMAPY